MMKFLSPLALISASLLLVQCSSELPLPAGSLRVDDPEATALFNEGKAKWTDGSLRSARKKFEELVEYHPLAKEAPDSLMAIGDIWMEVREPVEAFDAYNKLLERYPDSTLYKTALQKEADLAFGSANGEVTYNLLWMFDSKVDNSKTIEMLTKLRDNAPYSDIAPKALFEAGQVYQRSGNDDLAIKAYHQLIDAYPSNSYAPLAQFAIGEALLQKMNQGNRNKSNLKAAQEAYEDFLQRYSNHKLAPKAKADLADVRYRLASLNLDIARFYISSNDMNAALYYLQDAAHDQFNQEVKNEAREMLKELGVAPKAPNKLQAAPVAPEL